jgi:hypothetical protein
MRRSLFVVAATLFTSLAVLVVAPATTANTTPQWYHATVVLTAQGHGMQFNTWVTNVGTITHTGAVAVKTNFGILISGTLTLAPGQTWMSGGVLYGHMAAGTYWASIKASHVFQMGDPGALLGATTSDYKQVVIQ